MTSITFLGCFMKLDVCVLLNTFYGSVLALIGFAIKHCAFSRFCPFTWQSLHTLLFQCHSTLLSIEVSQPFPHHIPVRNPSFGLLPFLPLLITNFKIIPVSPHAKAFVSTPTPSGLCATDFGLMWHSLSPSEPFHALIHSSTGRRQPGLMLF